MSQRKLRSIKCTSCAAPLTLHGGGHKVRTLNCEFCGAVMDVRRNFEVLHKFVNQEKPYCPFKIGMQGEIKGIAFTIVGVVAWQDSERYQWVDLMLFSPTRGYAWLTYYNAHLVFLRRTRDIPNLNIWNLAPKYEFSAGGHNYKFFERSKASIVYVAGELTWVANKQDSVHLVEAIDPPLMYTVEHTGSEISYGLGEYLEDTNAIYQSFGITEKPYEVRSVHPAQPYRSRYLEPMKKAALPFIPLIALLLVAIMLFFQGEEIYSDSFKAADIHQGISTGEFEVTQPARLLELKVQTQLKNAWAWFDIEVRQGPNSVFSFGKEVGFYEGYDSDGYWAEGSRSATAHFRVPQAGTYSLHITESDGGRGNSPGGTPPPTTLRVTLKQGYVSGFYFKILLGLAVLATAIGFFARYSFESKRWGAVLGGNDE